MQPAHGGAIRGDLQDTSSGASFLASGPIEGIFDGLATPSFWTCQAGYRASPASWRRQPHVPGGSTQPWRYLGHLYCRSSGSFNTSAAEFPTCIPVPCPAGSNGTDVVSGCSCLPGYSGAVNPTQIADVGGSGSSPAPSPADVKGYTPGCSRVACPYGSMYKDHCRVGRKPSRHVRFIERSIKSALTQACAF